jgi:hypothetical protein
MAVGGDGEDAEGNAWRARRRSNWVRATYFVAFIGLIIALDWVFNERTTYVAPAVIGIAVGMVGLAVRLAWRRRSGRP